MATIEDAANAALAALDSQANLPLVGQWANERLQEAAIRARFRAYRKIGAVVVPAVLMTGTVSVTSGSPTVTGAGTTAVWSNVLAGRYFQAATVWYKILSATATTLTLEVPYSEPSVTGGTYHIVQRVVSLDPSARAVTSFWHQRLREPVDMISLDSLNALVPERQYVTFAPTLFADMGEDATGAMQVEMYPYSQTDELVNYVYYQRPPVYGLTDQLPGFVDAFILKEGVLIDLYRYEMMQANRKGAFQEAALLSNNARAQETVWQRKMELLTMSDRGVSDSAFVLAGASRLERKDIATAYDFVWARGGRP